MAIAVARYLPNGSLDKEFGGAGTVRLETDSEDGRVSVHTVAVDAQNRVTVVAGSARLLVARYLQNGALDQAFGQGGTVNSPFFPGSSGSKIHGATLAAPQQVIAAGPDPASLGLGGAVAAGGPRIVAAGEIMESTGEHHFALARYRLRGEPDSAFGGDGRVRTSFGAGSKSSATSVRMDRNGRIIAVGSVTGRGFAVARYLQDGDLDSEFGGDGKVETIFQGFGNSEASALALRADGGIVAVGHVTVLPAGHRAFAVVRYLPNGELDSEFGDQGKVVTDFPETAGSEAFGVAIDASTEIVVVGKRASVFSVARYHSGIGNVPAGTLVGGTDVTEFPSPSEARAVLVNVIEEEILAVGQAGNQFALARFRAEGQLDFSFGNNGKVLTPIGTSDERSIAKAVAADSQGRLIVAGEIFSVR